MSYVNNAPLIEAWDTRVSALKAKFATLTDGTTTNVVIEDTEANVLLSSVDGLTLDSNEQAPQIVVETPTLTLEPEEGSEESDQDENTDEDESEEETEESEEETVDETVEESEEESEVVSEDTEE